MKRFQSIAALLTVFAFAAPAVAGEASKAAKMKRLPAVTPAQAQIQKAPAQVDPGLAEKVKPQKRKLSPKLHHDTHRKIAMSMRPDLTVEAVPPQGSTSMRFFIRNQGATDAGSFKVSFTCSYFPYSNGLADPSLRQDCEISPITVSGVQAGAVDTRQIPASALPSGPVHVTVGVRVDSAEQVAELNETNNSDAASWH